MLWPKVLGAVIALPAFIVPFSVRMVDLTLVLQDSALAEDAPAAPPQSIDAPGFIEPSTETITISASAAGRLVSIKVSQGDSVTAGEIIAEIENDDLHAQLTAAEAELNLRQDELTRLQDGAREQERHEAQAALNEADVALWFAQTTFDRQSALLNKAVPQAAVDRARADFEGAKARRDVLAEKLSLIQAPPRPEDVSIAEAQVDEAKAQVSLAKALLEKTFVRSPIDGTVLRREAHAGETMALLPPTLIAEVGDVRRLRVRAEVDEADVGRIATGQDASITADAYPDQRFHGRVSQIGGMMGTKNFRTDQPGERTDTRVLDALIDLDPDVHMPVGLRVDVVLTDSSAKAAGTIGDTKVHNSGETSGQEVFAAIP